MRGELVARNDGFSRGGITPSTPGTASSNRQHNFQRMHSNDSGGPSDKDGGKVSE